MAILDFDNVVVTVDGKTANSMVNTAPVFAVDATWAGITDKPSVFPPAERLTSPGRSCRSN